MPVTPWPSAHVDRFVELFNEGLSLSMLSDALSSETGTPYSRNACAGQISRLRAIGRLPPGKKTTVKHRPRPRMKIAVVPDSPPIGTKTAKATEATEGPPASLDVSIYDLEPHHCRFPFGDWPPYRYCGNQTLPDLSWCPYHTRIVWQRA